MKPRHLTSLSRMTGAFAVALAVTVVAGTVWAGSSGRCHSAFVSSEVVLPNGSVHGPGTLTSCAQRTHSPTRTILELAIDGHPIHMVISRTDLSSSPSEAKAPFFVFHFDAGNRLVLQGYAVPKRGALLTYAMHPDSDRFEVTSSWELLARDYDAGKPQDPSTIFIAAAR